jgi:hypothetical protein
MEIFDNADEAISYIVSQLKRLQGFAPATGNNGLAMLTVRKETDRTQYYVHEMSTTEETAFIESLSTFGLTVRDAGRVVLERDSFVIRRLDLGVDDTNYLRLCDVIAGANYQRVQEKVEKKVDNAQPQQVT